MLRARLGRALAAATVLVGGFAAGAGLANASYWDGTADGCYMTAANWVSSTGWTNAQSAAANNQSGACMSNAVKIDDLSWHVVSPGTVINHVSGHWVADTTSHLFWTQAGHTYGRANPGMGCC